MEINRDIKTYGFGVVAQGFHNYLLENNEVNRLHTVIIKNPTKVRNKISAIIETTNSNTIRDKDVGVIVELISSSEEAYGIVVENLEIGKKVISANKKLIAENLEELVKIERDNGATFLYEGAVCGSIPIIRVLNDLYSNEPINEIKGIFNGSSNYILSKLFSEEISYQDALLEAQRLGFAEADPTSDVGGYDALYKLIIIAAHAFGKIVKPYETLNIGIESITKSDIEFVKSNNLKIKLIAKATLINDELNLSVFPTLIDSTNDLFNVENEYNAVAINSKNIGEQFYKGKGAGSLPTGAVVYSDLKAIDNGYSYSYKKMDTESVHFSNENKLSFLLSLNENTTIDDLELDRGNLFSLEENGKRFIYETTVEELIQNKFNFTKHNVSVLAIDNDKIKFLLKSKFRLEGIGLNY